MAGGGGGEIRASKWTKEARGCPARRKKLERIHSRARKGLEASRHADKLKVSSFLQRKEPTIWKPIREEEL